MGKVRVPALLFSMAVLLALAANVALGSGRPNVVTPSNTDVYRHTTANTPLSMTGTVYTTILSVSLPHGAWVISADATAVNYGNSDYFRCRVFKSGLQVGVSTATVGNASATTLDVITAVNSATAFTVALKCGHDGNLGAASNIDAGATLLAHKSTSLNTN